MTAGAHLPLIQQVNAFMRAHGQHPISPLPAPLFPQANRLRSSGPSIACQRGSNTASLYVDSGTAVAAAAARRLPARLLPPVEEVALSTEPVLWKLMVATCGPLSSAAPAPAALAKVWAAAVMAACSLTGWKYAKCRAGVTTAAGVTCSPSGQCGPAILSSALGWWSTSGAERCWAGR